jgi:2-hydroxyglutarate dehydrogenase
MIASRWIQPAISSIVTKATTRCFSTIKTPDLEVDNVVIGAGVVGLAIGEKLTRSRPTESTFVVEKNKRIGEETR